MKTIHAYPVAVYMLKTTVEPSEMGPSPIGTKAAYNQIDIQLLIQERNKRNKKISLAILAREQTRASGKGQSKPDGLSSHV